ncbi:MAG: hypothetical protein DMF68_00045, partial [Acidobacteria bacterium]
NIEAIRKEIEGRTLLREKISTSVELPLAPETKRVLAYAHEESDRLQHRHIGTEHLLLGLLREDRSMAAEILYERGLRLNAVRDEIAGGQTIETGETSDQSRNGIARLIDEIRSHGQSLVALSDNLRHGLHMTSVDEASVENFQGAAGFELMEILKNSAELKRTGKRTVLGLEMLLGERIELARGARVGLICNQASVDHNLKHAADLLHEHKDINLTTLFGPQHGIRGDVQDNMIETPHTEDAETGLPIYSLYSETREPTKEMLKDLDVLIFDMQDVGCRIYTFVYTMANCMRAARKYDKRVVVCDRPNPINGVDIGGNLLEAEFASFVGQFPIPTRHGMTVGELARMFNEHFGINCELEVVKMEGWERSMWLDETDAPWVMPSPNMPTLESATVFPGTVHVEGTEMSEGRGTTKPFELVGAPYIVATDYARELAKLDFAGIHFRPCGFQPTFQKQAGRTCGGVQIHVTKREEFDPVAVGVAVVKVAFDMYTEHFRWKEPPYEYVYDRNPFDVISGTDKLRAMIESGSSMSSIIDSWSEGLERFRIERQSFLLY